MKKLFSTNGYISLKWLCITLHIFLSNFTTISTLVTIQVRMLWSDYRLLRCFWTCSKVSSRLPPTEPLAEAVACFGEALLGRIFDIWSCSDCVFDVIFCADFSSNTLKSVGTWGRTASRSFSNGAELDSILFVISSSSLAISLYWSSSLDVTSANRLAEGASSLKIQNNK